MANRVFQNVVYQMKDAVDRVVGVVDETGTVISCSELGQIGEVREGVAAAHQTAGDAFVRDGYSYHQFPNAKHNDYAAFVEGTDETAEQFSAMLSISLQCIKQYHDEKFDRRQTSSKTSCWTTSCPATSTSKRGSCTSSPTCSRVVLLVRRDLRQRYLRLRCCPVVCSRTSRRTSSSTSARRDTVLVKEIKAGIDTQAIWKSWPASIVDTLQRRATTPKRSSASAPPSATSRIWPPASKRPRLLWKSARCSTPSSPGHQLRSTWASPA